MFDTEKLLDFFKDVNGIFDVLNFEIVPLPEKLMKLLDERELARKNKDFKKSDELRDKLLEEGVEIKDGSNGTTWTYLSK
jgi:cysteinyl-tRNA synthetase